MKNLAGAFVACANRSRTPPASAVFFVVQLLVKFVAPIALGWTGFGVSGFESSTGEYEKPSAASSYGFGAKTSMVA